MTPIATTDSQYYDNPINWGENQYITLENLLDNILIGNDDDSLFKHTKRFRARMFAKQGIKKLNVDVKRENQAISITVPPSKIFPFPRYMTNWSRASVLNKCNKLEMLAISNRPRVEEYSQDNDGEIFYDCDGIILTADQYHPEYGHCCVQIQCDDVKICEDSTFKDSWIKAVNKDAYFEFSDDLVGATVFIEFQSAGLEKVDDCDIKIHHDLEQTLTYWTQWKLSEGKRNIAKGDTTYFYQMFLKEKRRSQDMLGNKISLNEIVRFTSTRY